MDWDKLRIFYVVAKAGSFTQAGDVLHLSQSAVSRQISSLEDSVGLALFHRHARGLLLTEQGELLFSTAQDVFAKLSKVEGQLQDSQRKGRGPIVMTVSEFIGSTWLVPRLKDFRDQHPDVQLTIVFEDRLLDLGMREADIGIRLMKPEQPDLIQKHLTKIQFHICASKDYLEKYGAPKTIEELEDHLLIAFPDKVFPPFPNPNWFLDLAKIPLSHPNLLVMNSMYAILKSVKMGAGIAALPDYLIKKNSDLKVILPKVKRPDVSLYFVYPEERRNSERITKLRDFMIQHVEKTEFFAEF